MLLQYVQLVMNRFGLEVRDEEEGQGLVEYALIIVLIAIAAIAALTTLGEEVVSVFEEITGGLGGA